MSIPQATHATMTAHIQGIPAPTIIENNADNISILRDLLNDEQGYEIKTMEVFQEDSDSKIRAKGIMITLILKTTKNQVKFVIIPDDEFITELINGKTLNFATSQGVRFFQFNINTEKIESVWQPTKN